MIAYINGILTEKEPTSVVLDVSGMGYLVKISLQTYEKLPAVNSPCKLFILQIFREDSQNMYGFISREERSLFENLISVSGIGPATGMVFLSSMNSSEIIQAIVTEDVPTIKTIKGIGPKTAQRVIIELKDKLAKDFSGPISSGSTFAGSSIRNEALSALITLGLPKTTAEKSIDNILKRSSGDITLEEVIKLALK